MALLNFNAADVPAAKPFEPIPAGWYDAKITASEIKPTKDGSGKRLNLTFEIIGGDYNNRKVFEGLNIQNTSDKAQQIAQEQLSAICHSISVIQLKNTDQLHGKPMRIKVKVRPEDKVGGYEARNEISGYEPLGGKNGGGTGAAAPQRAAAAQPAPARNAPAGFGNKAPAKAAGFGNKKAADAETTAVAVDATQPWEETAPADAALAKIEEQFGTEEVAADEGVADSDEGAPAEAEAAVEPAADGEDGSAPWDN